jgi:putative membrane protein
MHNRDEVWKSIIAGAIGGLAASWAMNRYQELQSKAVQKVKQSTRKQTVVEMQQPVAVGQGTTAQPSQPEHEQRESQEPSTVKVAEIISINVLRHRLSEREKKIAEPIVHYSFGTIMGAWYGLLSEAIPLATTGHGALYGAVVWLGADEIALPALKVSNNPFKYPISVHASALSAHAVYGITTETVRRAVLKLIA